MPGSLPDRRPTEIARVLLAGAILLLVVHTLGRFIYTPLLPYLVDDGLLTPQSGAAIATWNYLGYLLGALLAVRWHRPDQIQRLLPWTLGLHVGTTLLQTQVTDINALTVLRWLNGLANGAVFVQAPALILEWLVLRRRANLSGLVYLGVGTGLLLSSGLVTLSASVLTGPARWWPAALLSIPLAWWAGRALRALQVPARPQAADGSVLRRGSLFDRASTPLFLSYAGAGLGYILPMTFLPLMAKQQLPAQAWLIDGAWLIVAALTLASAFIWNAIGSRFGDLAALRCNLVIQAFGVVAPVFLFGEAGIVLCASLIGCSWLGAVLLTQRIGRALHPHQGPRLSAALIAVYGLAQMSGPWLVEQWLERGGQLESAFWISVGALIWALGFAAMVPKQTTQTED